MKRVVPLVLFLHLLIVNTFSQVNLLVDITPSGTWQSINDLGTADGGHYYSFESPSIKEIKRYVNNSWETIAIPSGYESPHFLNDLPNGTSIWFFRPVGQDKSELFVLNNSTFSPLTLPAASATKNWIGVTYIGTLGQQHFYRFVDNTPAGSNTYTYEFYSYSNGVWSSPISLPHTGYFTTNYKDDDLLYVNFGSAGKLEAFDGTSWIPIPYPSSISVSSAYYMGKNNGSHYYLIYDTNDNAFLYSLDSTSWTPLNASLPSPLVGLHQFLYPELNIWDAFEANFENQSLVQFDGTNWNVLSLPISFPHSGYYFSYLTTINSNQFYSFDPNDGTPVRIFYTPDGVSWTEVSIPSNINYISAGYAINNSPFIKIAFSDGSKTLYKIPGTLCDESNIAVDYQMIFSGSYQAITDLTSSGQIDCTENVYFEAGNCITLQPGFEATGEFSATIGNCTPSSPFVSPLPALKTTVVTPTEMLLQAAPNPFSAATTINYQLPNGGTVNLYLTNAYGQRVQTLANQQYLAKGVHQIQLQSNAFQKGLYFLVLEQGAERTTRKLYLH